MQSHVKVTFHFKSHTISNVIAKILIGNRIQHSLVVVHTMVVNMNTVIIIFKSLLNT